MPAIAVVTLLAFTLGRSPHETSTAVPTAPATAACMYPPREVFHASDRYLRKPSGTYWASAAQYTDFVRGYRAHGGKIRYVRDYSCHGILIAWHNLELPPLTGRHALKIIVPVGVEVSFPAGMGHSTLFLMDGFRVEGKSGVEIFSDLEL